MITWIKRVPEAKIPVSATSKSAGLDLSTIETYTLQPGERHAFATGLSWDPHGQDLYLEIKPRSGLAVKHGIDTLAGIIDADYEGEIKIILINFGSEPVTFNAGDRIAQGLLQPVTRDNFCISEIATHIFGQSERGSGGFGSTGKN